MAEKNDNTSIWTNNTQFIIKQVKNFISILTAIYRGTCYKLNTASIQVNCDKGDFFGLLYTLCLADKFLIGTIFTQV